MTRAADLISERSNEISALMAMEVGKSRLEALGDTEETADLIRYYIKQMEDNHGFDYVMDKLNPNEHNRSVLRPYGVWAVISPFNFPMALAGGPAGGALVAGNTVVLKPSHQGFFTALKLYECLRDAGVPAGAFHVLTGPGSSVGAELVESRDVDGMTFTGSYPVGMQIYRTFAKDYPKPAICEMGGKNPAIVSAKADLDVATDGVMRSAFGFSGQKCSACSRAYVQRAVFDDFTKLLVEKASKLKVGNPLDRDVFTGPVIDGRAVETFEQAVADVKAGGGKVLLGGERISEGDLGARQLRAADDRRGAAGQPRVERGAVRALRGRGADRLDRRGADARQRHRVRADRGVLLRGRRRGRPVPVAHPGRRGLREPPGRRDDRRVAGRAAVRRLEGLGHHGTRRRRPALRAAVPARAGAERHQGLRRMATTEPITSAADLSYDALAGADRAAAGHGDPRAAGPRRHRGRRPGHEPVAAPRVPARARARGRRHRAGRRRERVPRPQRGHRRVARPATPTRRWSRRSARRPGG